MPEQLLKTIVSSCGRTVVVDTSDEAVGRFKLRGKPLRHNDAVLFRVSRCEEDDGVVEGVGPACAHCHPEHEGAEVLYMTFRSDGTGYLKYPFEGLRFSVEK